MELVGYETVKDHAGLQEAFELHTKKKGGCVNPKRARALVEEESITG